MDKIGVVVKKNNTSNETKSSKPPENAENPVADLMKKAFQIDLIRKAIIGHAIQNAFPRWADVGAVRLVQKSWLRDVTSILLKTRIPLYELNLNGLNSLNSSEYVQRHQQKILDHFISTVALSPSRLEKSIPPFCLTIQEEFFHDENHASFSNFLTGGSAAGLTSLHMCIPKNGGSMDFVFPLKTLSFPILQELSVQFTEVETHRQSTFAVYGSNAHFLPFLQSFLHGASELKTFALLFSSNRVIPNGIRYLTLPPTLTSLYLECMLTTVQLEGLAANFLPHLKHLMFNINNIPFSNGLILRVLDQYKKTLQKLQFGGIIYNQEYIPRDVTYFSFPVMESLTVFASSSIHAELEADLAPLLHTFLPKLEDVLLHQQTVEMFRKWTDACCFPAVTKLAVGLVDDNVAVESQCHDLTLRLEEMQLVHMAFPNVTELYLNVTGEDTCGLKYLFMEMKQLRGLSIEVRGSAQYTNPYHWDCLLTGVPQHVLETLNTNPQLLEYLSLDTKHECCSSSVKNLTALQFLRLYAKFSPGAHTEPQKSLISSAAFNLALLKMPNLKTLHLTGRFMVSPETIHVWESEQRSIYYTDDVAD